MTGHHFVTVSVFCLLCATHSPCESHSTPTRTDENLRHLKSLPNTNDVGMTAIGRQQVEYSPHTRKPPNDGLHGNDRLISVDSSFKANSKAEVIRRGRRSAKEDATDDNEYLRTIFARFGDGKHMTIQGFQDLMDHLDIKKFLTENVRKRSDKESTKNSNSNSTSAAATVPIDKDSTSDNDTCTIRSAELKSRLFPNKDEKNNHHHHHHDEEFASSTTTSTQSVDDRKFMEFCPAILLHIMSGCSGSSTVFSEEDLLLTNEQLNNSSSSSINNSSAATVWLYSFLSVILISACGVLGLAMIPLMKKRFYQPLLQFLVALAVGTLSGDALLHLLPHAISEDHHESGAGHDHHHGGEPHGHGDRVWKGFIAMLGLIFLFFMESALNFISEWKKSWQRKEKIPSKVKVMKDSESNLASVSCEEHNHHHHKKASFCNYCVCEKIAARVKEGPSKHNGLFEQQNFWRLGSHNEDDEKSPPMSLAISAAAANNCSGDGDQEFIHHEICAYHKRKLETNQNNHTECPNELTRSLNQCSNVNKMMPIDIGTAEAVPEEYTVILREHETKHHGHSHKHGHVHTAPTNLKSVAWMVIMGDGLHNFTDGMAIGAAFAVNVTGGFSTTIAVLCHELPHEIGDFAVLLKAGMSMKQALFYNFLSSILCLIGNVVGVWLGHSESGNKYIFACTAGMFLYIALVDMIPELSSGQNAMSSLLQPLLQILGLLTGLCIMTLIALYEHELKNIFYDHN